MPSHALPARERSPPATAGKHTLPTFGLAGTQVAHARGLRAAAGESGRADGIPRPLPARLPRADDFERVPAALSTGADQDRPEPAAARSRTTCARASRGCAACSTRAAASPTGRASGTRTRTTTGAATGARPTPGTSCSKPRRPGYKLPGDMKAAWLRYQKSAAQQWSPNYARRAAGVRVQPQDLAEASRYAQAYRLYTLALAGQPELGAMNRLREQALTLGERWMLASAYQLAGKTGRGEGAGGQPARCRRSCSPTRIRTRSARCCAIARWC